MTPYQQGQQAFDDGLKLSDNPYDEVTQLSMYELWEEGWLDSADFKYSEF